LVHALSTFTLGTLVPVYEDRIGVRCHREPGQAPSNLARKEAIK
jgi:hypothetical protein